MGKAKKVCVIGGGIIGMSSALMIQEQMEDVEVTVIAEKLSPHTTGDGSAGFWHPYLLGDVAPDILRSWCMHTLEFLQEVYKSPDAGQHGVGIAYIYRIYSNPPDRPVYDDLFLEWRPMTEKEHALFPKRYKYGIFLTSYFAECTKLLPMLMKRFKSKGGNIIQKRVNSLSELCGEYDVLVNCAGVEASQLVPDPSLVPIRGQVIRVCAPWIKHGVVADEDFYILPNSEEMICGGTHQEEDWNLKPDPADRKMIWDACTEIIPSLKNARIVREWVGLRPGRSSPRLEREKVKAVNGDLEVIHNYGHGGSGVTLFWGCAHDVLHLLRETLADTTFPSKL